MPDPIFHGGDVWQISASYGIPVESLLDFSANINPRGLPLAARQKLLADAGDVSLLAKYPDPSYTELRSTLAKRLGVTPDSILVGEGAEALIGAVLRTLRRNRCLLPVPAFGEYARACESAGTETEMFQLYADQDFVLDENMYFQRLRECRYDCVILNNPHNPSGTLLRSRQVIALVEQARTADAFALVDEAFMDYAPDETIVSYASGRPGVVVIRSLTKFFGCPALRVGYLVGHLDTVQHVAQSIPTWPVTTLAANALQAALEDEEYVFHSLRENEGERASLSQSLRELGALVFPSATNFLLIRLPREWPNSSTTRDFLIRNHGIVVRSCDSFAGLEIGRYIRIAVRTADDNAKLLRGLREIGQ